MSRPHTSAHAAPPSNLLPPQAAESKRDRKRRETVNKIELLHSTSWQHRDEKFSQQYKEYHNENKAVNTQPPTSQKYLLRLYPKSIERDAFLQRSETHYEYASEQAERMYKSERAHIEQQYWEARDQIRSRLLAAMDERRRKLTAEKEGGDIVSEALLEAQTRPRPRRAPIINRAEPRSVSSRTDTPLNLRSGGDSGTSSPPEGPKNSDDLMLHNLLAPQLAVINTDDILSRDSSVLTVKPPPNGFQASMQSTKRGRGKGADGDKEAGTAAGTGTGLANASGPAAAQATAGGKRTATVQSGWVLGKALNDMKRMEEATILERESDWSRIQGSQTGRGRRARGD
ncbi:hypothetical protein CcaverHIS002_0410070 [Cutaneotrichosporon cavernicola]|uniref:Uncharacterized protein n=1 Tax=Cutaneotrichosporon cavernicola TaxID=279322 RepID=A0AA48QWA3_9TREE|nr:uncharacterized protein CcaverHIS019_0409980 [Cutaneotrichosporon cavernicola]BEI84403.1 hypothetical protein CcaverHIS002_0410070 [Cutaneotrichosporon cavernicola]BEI92178.1 hypothetical protein CcaverHIS019_0409980 [Cutaneotrichosporon cavernicola]BEI99948.1 hypothetical protein CcaverHIS631_0409910 [Cutaneotrichosporon cavernicola]BEJ07723.1 hypothetical protein CcaverHIS641_0409920 [Cutaneotrichosporon cavernicola]